MNKNEYRVHKIRGHHVMTCCIGKSRMMKICAERVAHIIAAATTEYADKN